MAMPPRNKKKNPLESVSTSALVRDLKKSLKNKLRQARASGKSVRDKE
jgi:hypothetical protein